MPKRVSVAKFNSVERCWMEMLNRCGRGLDFELSLFLLSDSPTKRACENMQSYLLCRKASYPCNAFMHCRWFLCVFACCSRSTIPEWKERLLIVAAELGLLCGSFKQLDYKVNSTSTEDKCFIEKIKVIFVALFYWIKKSNLANLVPAYWVASTLLRVGVGSFVVI